MILIVKLFNLDVTIVEEDFVNSDIYNPRFAKVTSIIVEPTNSCSAIIDKLGYMLQEEEFPADKPTQKDLYALKRQQVIALKHAFKCKYFNNLVPFVDSVLYITRSTHKEENGQVVEEVLDRYGVDWTLWPVVGNNSQDQSEDFEETFPLPTGSGNGTYLAQFRLKKAIKEKEEEIERHRQSLAEMSVLDLETKIPKRRSSKPAEKFIPQAALKRIPKNIVVTVERLSVPKRYMGEVVPPVKRTIFASSSKKFKSEHSSIAEPRSDDDIIKKLTNMSLFGSNLSKFFSPQAEALEKIKLKHLELSSTQLVL